jgi:hypothetical protein
MGFSIFFLVGGRRTHAVSAHRTDGEPHASVGSGMPGHQAVEVEGDGCIGAVGSWRRGVRASWPRGVGRWMVALTAAVAGFGAFACSVESPEPDSGAPIPLDQFCAEYSTAVCDRMERCSCSSEILLACRTRFRDECAAQMLDPVVQARLRSGVIRYDDAAAGRLVAQIRGLRSCGSLVGELGWTLADRYSVGGVFTGTKGAGESCSPLRGRALPLSECFASPCSDDETEGVFVCLGPQTVGSPCSGPICIRSDVPLRDPYVNWRSLLLLCSPTTARCQARVPLGSPCSRSIECDSGYCNTVAGRCEPALADGQACSSSLECASANCDESAAGSTCTPRRPEGSACAYHDDCASGVCMMRRCVPGACVDAGDDIVE